MHETHHISRVATWAYTAHNPGLGTVGSPCCQRHRHVIRHRLGLSLSFWKLPSKLKAASSRRSLWCSGADTTCLSGACLRHMHHSRGRVHLLHAIFRLECKATVYSSRKFCFKNKSPVTCVFLRQSESNSYLLLAPAGQRSRISRSKLGGTAQFDCLILTRPAIYCNFAPEQNRFCPGRRGLNRAPTPTCSGWGTWSASWEPPAALRHRPPWRCRRPSLQPPRKSAPPPLRGPAPGLSSVSWLKRP